MAETTAIKAERQLLTARALLWAAGAELNAIHARDGAPDGVSHEYFGNLVEAIRLELGGDIKPWCPPDLKPALNSSLDRARGEQQ